MRDPEVPDRLDLITPLEGALKAGVSLRRLADDTWILSIRLIYDGEPAGSLSFNLQGYEAEEAHLIARNVPGNPALMRAIDEYLWGESD